MPDLAGLPGVASLAPAEETEVDATYVDTADLALAEARITLSRRTGGAEPGWLLELPTHDGRHTERQPAEDDPALVPARLRDLVQVVVRDQPLAPVARVCTRRTVHRMLEASGTVQAEVVDDRVTATTTDVTGATTRWREWRVRPVEGGRRLLGALAELLEGAGAEPAAPTLAVDTPASAVVRARLAEQVGALVRLDPLVRCDAPDAVHAMRVATRRLRSALATFRPLVDRDATEPLRVEVRELGVLLGEARDTEVLAELLRDVLDPEVAAVGGAEARDHVLSDLRHRYARAHRHAVAALRSERYLQLVDALQDLAADAPLTVTAERPTDKVLRGRVRHDWERLADRVRAMRDAEGPEERGRALHDVRKAAKRARYAAEPLVPAYGKDARRFVRRLEHIQSVLGEHHDLLVARAELPGLARRAAADGVDGYVLGVAQVRLEQRTAASEAAFEQAWRRASAKKNLRWLP
jgi:CHAD domain-containing protein